VGQRAGMEERMAQQAGIRFAGIIAGKYRRVPDSSLAQKLSDVGSLALNVRDLGRTLAGIVQSLAILRRFKPDVVFCKGGFVALPVGMAAHLLHIPIVIHESDVVPGLGTKILARYAQTIAVGFPTELYPRLPAAKLLFTGNPVRPEILHGNRDRAAKKFDLALSRKTTLILGGSQGAQGLNGMVLADLPRLIQATQIIHITGMYDQERINRQVRNLHISHKEGYIAKSFMEAGDLADAYAIADLVVSRAGANTIAELAALHKATILVPNYQSAAHQLVNANRLEQSGAVALLPEDTFQASQLAEQVSGFLRSATRRKQLGDALAAYNVPHAAELLAQTIQAVGAGRPLEVRP